MRPPTSSLRLNYGSVPRQCQFMFDIRRVKVSCRLLLVDTWALLHSSRVPLRSKVKMSSPPIFYAGEEGAAIPIYFQPPFPVGGFGPGYGGYGYQQQQFGMQPWAMPPVLPGYNWAMSTMNEFQCQPSIRMEVTSQMDIPPEVVIGEDSGYGPRSRPENMRWLSGNPRQRGQRRSQLEEGCRFCKSTGESAEVWKSHVLREDGKVTCPVLRGYVCPICHAEGDDAHTISYCPKNGNADSRVHIHVRGGHNAAGKVIWNRLAPPRRR